MQSGEFLKQGDRPVVHLGAIALANISEFCWTIFLIFATIELLKLRTGRTFKIQNLNWSALKRDYEKGNDGNWHKQPK